MLRVLPGPWPFSAASGGEACGQHLQAPAESSRETLHRFAGMSVIGAGGDLQVAVWVRAVIMTDRFPLGKGEMGAWYTVDAQNMPSLGSTINCDLRNLP